MAKELTGHCKLQNRYWDRTAIVRVGHFAGSAAMAEILDQLEQLAGLGHFLEALDLEGSDPEGSDPDYGVDLGAIVGDTTGYVDEFFGAQNYGDEYDQISDALGVIADAKFESAVDRKIH